MGLVYVNWSKVSEKGERYLEAVAVSVFELVYPLYEIVMTFQHIFQDLDGVRNRCSIVSLLNNSIELVAGISALLIYC